MNDSLEQERTPSRNLAEQAEQDKEQQQQQQQVLLLSVSTQGSFLLWGQLQFYWYLLCFLKNPKQLLFNLLNLFLGVRSYSVYVPTLGNRSFLLSFVMFLKKTLLNTKEKQQKRCRRVETYTNGRDRNVPIRCTFLLWGIVHFCCYLLCFLKKPS